MKLVRYDEEDKQREIKRLITIVKPGDRVYTVRRFRSKRSGAEIIDVFVIIENKPFFIGQGVAAAIGFAFDTDRDGIFTGGFGMDYAIDVVLRLSSALFGNAYKLEAHKI